MCVVSVMKSFIEGLVELAYFALLYDHLVASVMKLAISVIESAFRLHSDAAILSAVSVMIFVNFGSTNNLFPLWVGGLTLTRGLCSQCRQTFTVRPCSGSYPISVGQWGKVLTLIGYEPKLAMQLTEVNALKKYKNDADDSMATNLTASRADHRGAAWTLEP